MRPLHRFVLLLIVGCSLSLNLYHLEQPNRLVSDEWYFVQDAQKYARSKLYTDAHPPLGKMQIAVSLKMLGDRPWTWRILNAVSGSLLIVVVAWLVWELTRRPGAVLLASFGMLLNGFLVTESRTAMINLPYILYGFLVVAMILRARRAARPHAWLAGAGLAIGLALAVKWLAALIVIPAILLWFYPHLFHQGLPRARLRARVGMIWLVVVPILLYIAIFWLHFWWLGAPQNIWGTHFHMLSHHLGARQGHPYREVWWRWPLLWQPFPYWSELREGTLSVIWSMPNPLLWWMSWLVGIWAAIRDRHDSTIRTLLLFSLWAWLPVAIIQRDMFLYHAFALSIWLTIVLAVVADQVWHKKRALVIGGLLIASASFVWFLPWYLNQPLSTAAHQWRQWLPTWKIGESELKAIRGGGVGLPPSESR